MDKEKIDRLCKELDLSEYAWISAQDIVVAQWVRIKCMFGCSNYGHGACPPNVPSVEECREFIGEYSNAILFYFSIALDEKKFPSEWGNQITEKMLALEKEVFNMNYPKAFLLNHSCCNTCKHCKNDRSKCTDNINARPSPEGFAIDVFETTQNAGYELKTIANVPAEMKRIAILLLN